MKVVETIKADLPISDSNHGITRSIPFTNQNGKNRTVDSKSSLNFSAKMDGKTEPFSINKEDDEYYVKIGSSDVYVHGEHTYELTYYFTNVIANVDSYNSHTFETDDAVYQDLYWDVNGTGSSYTFPTVTATVHLDENIQKNLYKTTSSDGTKSATWCYTGAYGAKESNCEINETNDGFYFTTNGVDNFSGLTIDIDFNKNTFQVPKPKSSYIFIYVGIIEIILVVLILRHLYKKRYLPNKEKIDHMKGIPTPPQYEPKDGYHAAEISQIYMKNTKNDKVATLLELIVSKKIDLVKTDKKSWSVIVKNIDGLTKPQNDLLKIINGATDNPKVGDEIKMEHHSYSFELDKVFQNYQDDAIKNLVESGDFSPSVETSPKTSGNVIMAVVVAAVPTYLIGLFGAIGISSYLDYTGLDPFLPMLAIPEIILVAITAITYSLVSDHVIVYEKRTIQGLDLSNYIEGLKLYIGMAEADRIAFLQSVNGAEMTNSNIIILYEKLLPYAALFGMEKSWMQELSKYYQLENISAPDWYYDGFAYSALFHSMSSTVSRPADPSSSSSSGGGGGGGFSGGGGGGGSVGGW